MISQEKNTKVKLTKYVKEKLKQALGAKQRSIEQLEQLNVQDHIFTLQEFTRLQIPEKTMLTDALWKLELVDIKRQQWKIIIKPLTLRQIGYQLKVNPPYDKNEVEKILSAFNSNSIKKNEKCKAKIDIDKTLSLQYTSPFHQYNKNKKIQKIIQTMDKVQKYLQTIFKDISQYTSISYSFSKKTGNEATTNEQGSTINISNSTSIPTALSQISQSVTVLTEPIITLPDIPNLRKLSSISKNGIVKFFQKCQTIGNENYVNGYAEDCESLSVLLFGKYKLDIASSLYENSNLSGFIQCKPQELKLIKKKIQKKIQKVSTNAFTSQINMLRLLRNDAACQFIAQYYMKTIKANQKDNSDFFFVQIYDQTLQNIVRQNRLTLQGYMKVFADIACGILYLNEDRKILHRDIKASNVCIQITRQTVIPKIIDFGSSCQLQPSIKVSNNYFTPGYHLPFDKCPQSIKNKYKTKENYYKNQGFDVYSFGVMLQWFLGCYMKRNVSLLPRTWSQCMQIIKRCKLEDPSQRPKLSTLIGTFSYLSMLQ